MSSPTTAASPKRAVLKGGLIGCGYVAKSHLAAWRLQTLGSLLAVCDLDFERARHAADSFGVPRVFSSPEQMIKECDLDFVEICTRPNSHESLIQLSAKYQLDILCQKPLAPDLATIDRMIAVCQEHGVRCMVHENWRFRPWYVQMGARSEKVAPWANPFDSAFNPTTFAALLAA
ncbi:MAG: Gfo/Idh/MocA family oxidoreductase [Planctomycetota bacterium]